MSKIPILNIETFHPEFKKDIYVNDFETHLNTFHKDILKPHNHNFYLVVLFTSGSGIHSIDFKNYEITPGSLFFLKPGQTHHWVFDQDPQGYIFFHSADLFPWMFRERRLNHYEFFQNSDKTRIELSSSQNELFTSFFENLLSEFQSQKKFKAEKLTLLIDQFYIETSRIISGKTSNKATYHIDIERLEHLKSCINEHFKTHKSVTFYSQELAISTRQLNRSVNKILGKSIQTLIHEKVLFESNLLLTYTNKTVKEIANELGYEDPSYFIRFYKKNLTYTPSEFRKDFGMR